MQILQAIRKGKAGPLELVDFQLRQQFWERFGLRLEDLDEWPRIQVDDYIMIMQLEAKVQNDANNANGSGGGSPDVTEGAWEAMKKARTGG